MKKVIENLKIDKVIHEKARLLIMTIVASRPNKKIDFNELKNISQLTSGNLSIQLKKLEDAGYLKLIKGYKGKRPNTEIELTETGKNALDKYLEEIEKILKIYRGEV